MSEFEILHENFEGKGPFTWLQLKELAEEGALAFEQEVRKVGSEDTVSLHYALIFYSPAVENEEKKQKGVSKWKLLTGVTLVLVGLLILGALAKLYWEGNSIELRQFFLGAIFTVTGITFVFGSGEKPEGE